MPFAAGGPTDTVTRLIAEPMSASLGQQIVVQNVAGAGGTLAAGEVAAAEPDGYTVLMHHIGMSTAPSLYKELAYNPLEDFKTIGLVTEVPMTIIARKDFEPTDLKSLVDYVKANQDTVTYANAGIGAASHLCGLLFMSETGTKVTEVPYQGTGPALTDLVGGQVDFMCDQTTNTTGQIKAGEVKAYAITTAERNAALPDLPTTAEGGLPGVKVSVWHGLYVPAATADAIVAKLSEALKAALHDETVGARFAELGTAPVADELATPQAHRDYLAGADRQLEERLPGGGRAAAIETERRTRPTAAASSASGGGQSMQKSLRDLVAGLIFVAFGLAFAGIALTYDLGSALRMGPGYFPLLLGCLLVLLGMAITVEGLVRGEDAPIGAIPWRGLLFLTAAVLVFGFSVRRLGMAPALFLAVLLAAFSSERTSVLAALAMAAGLTVVCVLIFVEGLGMPVPLLGPWLRF